MTGREILDLLKEINRDHGTTVLCNLHDVGQARRIADRVLGLRAGEIDFDDRPDRLSPGDVARIYGDSLRELRSEEVIP